MGDKIQLFENQPIRPFRQHILGCVEKTAKKRRCKPAAYKL